MQTSLKTGFAQIFSCYPKTLSCPKFEGAAAPLAPPPQPVRLWRWRCLLHKGQYEVFISAWVHDPGGGGLFGFQVTGMIKGFFWV